MAFFKSFQESLSSVSVSSILDSVSSTVSNTVEGVKTTVSDVTYTVSDHLTEQVNTIINKKQGEDEDKEKRDEGEATSQKDSDSRTGAGERINSKRHAYADEEEEQREREKQEQERRNEEEQWEWCYAPSKGWYRKRRDPNQRDTSVERQAERQVNKKERTGASAQLSSSNGDMNLPEVTAVRMENNEGGQEDTITKTRVETVYCEDMGTEQSPNSNNKQTEDTREGHAQDRDMREGHAQDQDTQEGHAQDREESQSDGRRNSTSTKPTQNTGGGAAEAGVVEGSSVETQLPEDGDSEEGSSRSRAASVLKDQQNEDEAMGSQGNLEVTEVSGDSKDTQRSFNKDRFRRCTLL